MNSAFTGIQWTAPQNSIFFIVYGIALLVLIYRLKRSSMVIAILGRTINGHRFLYNTSVLRIGIKSMLWALSVLCLFLTLLHPSWNKKEHTVVQEGRDVFIALDISRSMLAQDISPNRLDFAKAKISSLIKALNSERIGLILFAGSSFIQCPLTRDRAAFLLYLNQIDVDTIASGTTALDQAIAQAINAFKMSGTQKSKLLVVFTDGEDFSSSLETLKKEALDQGITIFTVGVGTAQGAPIPLFDQSGKQSGHLRDKKGTVVISALNQGILQTLAHDVGGIYIHATHDTKDLNTLISLVQKKEKEKIEERKISHFEEQYPWFLMVSFLLLAIEWLL